MLLVIGLGSLINLFLLEISLIKFALNLFDVVGEMFISPLKLMVVPLVFFSLVSGAYEFRPPKGNLKHNYIKMLDCLNCPVWKNEIQKWKIDNQYMIEVWP